MKAAFLWGSQGIANSACPEGDPSRSASVEFRPAIPNAAPVTLELSSQTTQ